MDDMGNCESHIQELSRKPVASCVSERWVAPFEIAGGWSCQAYCRRGARGEMGVLAANRRNQLAVFR